MDDEKLEKSKDQSEKSGDRDEKMYTEYAFYVPGGATSFQQLDDIMAAEDEANRVATLARQFKNLVDNIMYSDDIVDKGVAVSDLADEFQNRISGVGGQQPVIKEQSFVDKALDLVSKATWTAKYVNDLPDSSFLFIESGGKKDKEGKTAPRSLRHLPYKDANGKVDLPHLRNAISRLGQEDTGKDWKGFNRKSLQTKAQRILDNSGKSKKTSFMLIKGESGQWSWFARYSNKYRDNDNPPEIISERSHEGFVEKVRSGHAPYPELWLWHVPGTAWGKAKWVGYDTSGYALAAGYVYPEYNEVAETLSERKDIALSHGMPVSTIVRDKNDPSIIVEHETREISPLTREAAANKMTGFVLFEENAMSDEMKQKGISSEDRGKLEGELGISPDVIDAMEAANAAESEAADKAGIESKEANAEEAPVETDVVEEVAEDVANGDEPDVTVKVDVSDEIKETLGDVMDAVVALNEKLEKSIEAIRGEINSVKSAQEATYTAIEETPLASRRALVKSIIGDESTLVDGRTTLGRDKPSEEQKSGGPFFFQTDEFLSGGQS